MDEWNISLHTIWLYLVLTCILYHICIIVICDYIALCHCHRLTTLYSFNNLRSRLSDNFLYLKNLNFIQIFSVKGEGVLGVGFPHVTIVAAVTWFHLSSVAPAGVIISSSCVVGCGGRFVFSRQPNFVFCCYEWTCHVNSPFYLALSVTLDSYIVSSVWYFISALVIVLDFLCVVFLLDNVPLFCIIILCWKMTCVYFRYNHILTMHSVLLGVVRQFVFLWFDSSSHGKPIIWAKKINAVDSMVTNCKPPHEIKRLPRSLTLRKLWKASEWRSFLLFYSPVCLKRTLLKRFFDHWCLLVFAIYQLMGPDISKAALLNCEMALCKLVALIPSLYGEEHLRFNVHLLTHLSAGVQRWGPFWATSAFFLEDANDKLLTFFSGTRGVCRQVFKSFIGANHLQNLTNRYVNNGVCLRLLDKLTNLPLSRNEQKLASNLVALGTPIQRTLNAREVDSVLSLHGFVINNRRS